MKRLIPAAILFVIVIISYFGSLNYINGVCDEAKEQVSRCETEYRNGGNAEEKVRDGIEGGHGAAVVCNGIHRLHGGLHHLGEVGAVILRAAPQDVQQGVQIVRAVAVLQAAQQAPQLVDGLAHGVAALGHKTVQGAGRRAGGCQQVPGIGCRSVEALEQALRLAQNVFHIIRHIAEHRRQQGVRQLLQLGHQSDGVPRKRRSSAGCRRPRCSAGPAADSSCPPGAGRRLRPRPPRARPPRR